VSDKRRVKADGLTVTVPSEIVEAIAARAAELAVEKLHGLAKLILASPQQTEYVTVVEAAEFLRAKPQRVHDLTSAGRLTRYKDRSRTLIRRAQLEAYLAGDGARRLPRRCHPRRDRAREASGPPCPPGSGSRSPRSLRTMAG